MIRTHSRMSKHDARRLTLEALRRQRLADPERIVDAYPFQLSGGMCQRVMIAIATVLRPKVIMADDVAVMYAGRIIEQAPAADVFAAPRHPYTAGLMAARPRLDRPDDPLTPIRGGPPELSSGAPECAFLPRCAKATMACRTQPWPALTDVAPQHVAACYNPMFAP